MELDHVSHPDHKLSYSKSVQRGAKPEVCAACRDEISSEHYSCSQCNFFIHKQCAERPEELRHSLHPAHPLHLHHKSPYAHGDAECRACYKRVEGFTYHCAVCEFDLDFICALPDGLKLNHMSQKMELDYDFHHHTLSYRKSYVQRWETPDWCAACCEEISSEHYSCSQCRFFLHKLCAERPQEISHSLHPLHPLRLLHKTPSYYSGYVSCDACEKTIEGFIYHCAICKFDIDFTCAFPDGSKVWHSHILTFEKVVKRADKQLVCAACLEDISGPLADFYSCRKCGFFLHRSCAERPRKLIHPLHPKHTLQLFQKDPNDKGSSACPSCQKAMNGFVYHCQDCRKFDIDFKCAFPKPENRTQNLEQVHHHPLIFFPKASTISCNLCSSAAGVAGEEEQSYACSSCDFMVHKSCALTELTQRYKHEHPLSLVQGVTDDLQIYGAFFCDVCHNTVTPEDSVAHCAPCRYFVHVRCMITGETGLISSIKDDVEYLNDSLIQLVLSGDDFVYWPQSDVSSELIQPFLLGKNGIVMNAEPVIRDFSHEEHDMILFTELSVNNNSFFKEEDEEILCDACNHPISAPYYCCHGCNYYLHLPCANLPSKISHSSHRHDELYLSSQSRCYNYSKCHRCRLVCNGFFYRCDTCDFCLDLTCAALPGVIIHESHEHPLFQMKQEYEGLCYCCNNRYEGYGDGIFKCRSCEVYLHYNCAMYSRSIRHRWDRQHPLDLKYPPHAEHPDHIMCDMCEELVHPMRWLYSCFKCKVSFHTDCAPKYHQFPNIKYGGKVKIFHPHILKYLRIATLKITCDKCEAKLDADDVFECETCYYCICSGCVRIEDEEIQISDLCHEGLKLLFGEVGDE